ncbi:MAG: hypothetical protein ACE5NJ_09250, partial [Thermodesulfobacteriota bacterium]
MSLKTPWKWVMGRGLMRRNLWIMVAADAALVFACYYLAYLIRFEFDIPEENLAAFRKSWHFIVPIKISVFAIFHVYRGMWRYTGLVDLVNLVKAVFTSSLLIVLIVIMIHQFYGYPRSVFIMDGFLTFLAIGGVRVAIRLYFARDTGMQSFQAILRRRP